MKKALITTLCNLMNEKKNIYMFTGDLGFGVMNPILERHRERFVNAGICEQNLVSAATGMALEGNIVFVYSIGNFPTLRCMEQIRNDAAYHNADVKIIAVGGGFAYGQLGMSHHATEDVAMMRTIPGMTVLAPADPSETVDAVKLAVEQNGPVYIRLGRGGEPNLKHCSFNIKKAMELAVPYNSNGSVKISFIGSGIVLPEVLAAAEKLSESYCVKVYSLALIKPFDMKSIQEICTNSDYVFTVEEHQVTGGIGSLVADVIAENGVAVRFRKIGLEDTFTQVVGSPSYLRKVYGLDSEGIVKTVKRVVEG